MNSSQSIIIHKKCHSLLILVNLIFSMHGYLELVPFIRPKCVKLWLGWLDWCVIASFRISSNLNRFHQNKCQSSQSIQKLLAHYASVIISWTPTVDEKLPLLPKRHRPFRAKRPYFTGKKYSYTVIDIFILKSNMLIFLTVNNQRVQCNGT